MAVAGPRARDGVCISGGGQTEVPWRRIGSLDAREQGAEPAAAEAEALVSAQPSDTVLRWWPGWRSMARRGVLRDPGREAAALATVGRRGAAWVQL